MKGNFKYSRFNDLEQQIQIESHKINVFYLKHGLCTFTKICKSILFLTLQCSILYLYFYISNYLNKYVEQSRLIYWLGIKIFFENRYRITCMLFLDIETWNDKNTNNWFMLIQTSRQTSITYSNLYQIKETYCWCE